MRKKVLILAGTVLLLTLVLAIPASASKPIDVWFKATISTMEDNCQARQVGNRCFVTFGFTGTYDGPDIYGNWAATYSTLAKGPCDTGYGDCGPGPFAYAESAHTYEVVTDAMVRDEQGTFRQGTFTDSCQGKVGQDPVRWEDWECVFQSGTGELANLRGISKYSLADEMMWGQVHFDPE